MWRWVPRQREGRGEPPNRGRFGGTLLRRMDHRGACGCEENTGDGSLASSRLCPTDSSRAAVKSKTSASTLPESGQVRRRQRLLAAASTTPSASKCKAEVSADRSTKRGNASLAGGPTPVAARGSPTSGPTAKNAAEPIIEQLVIEAVGRPARREAFERKVYHDPQAGEQPAPAAMSRLPKRQHVLHLLAERPR